MLERIMKEDNDVAPLTGRIALRKDGSSCRQKDGDRPGFTECFHKSHTSTGESRREFAAHKNQPVYKM